MSQVQTVSAHAEDTVATAIALVTDALQSSTWLTPRLTSGRTGISHSTA